MCPKKQKLPKQKSKSALIKKLDTVYSLYIRYRDLDNNGLARCFTCGKRDDPKNLHCGHYWSRRHLSVRWEEANTEVQCYACNCMQEGNKPAFTIALIRKHGVGILDKLEWKKNNEFAPDAFTLDLLIKEYTEKLKLIKK
jgi:hypothetical protein